MFDAVRNNKRVVQVVLLLMVLPFAFFGVESYMNRDAVREDAAVVGKLKIARRSSNRRCVIRPIACATWPAISSTRK